MNNAFLTSTIGTLVGAAVIPGPWLALTICPGGNTEMAKGSVDGSVNVRVKKVACMGSVSLE